MTGPRRCRTILWLGLLLLLPGCAFHKTVRTELVIPASPEAIWAVLTDAAGYAAWNPALIEANGTYAHGAEIAYRMQEPGDKISRITATVARFDPPRLLNQTGGIPGIVTFDHKYILEPVDGGTRVIQHEDYRGLWIAFWDESWVEPAYRRANRALRARVAAMAAGG